MKKMDELLVENDRLRILARHDSLTGLFNRGAMEEEIGALLRNKKGGVFLMLDVDHFKDINDVYGHLTGDLVLQELSRIMGYLFFKKDIIGRMGGDEFAIFIPGMNWWIPRWSGFIPEQPRPVRIWGLGTA